jgi:hypothetical protein
MTDRIPVSDADIAREFCLRHVRGSPGDAATNPALRICLTNCVELRKRQKRTDQPKPDGKRLAAGDTE